MFLNVGDSASSCRHWRNGVPHTREKGEKMGGVREVPGNCSLSPPPIFSPLVSHGGTHHSAANAVSERNPLRETTKTRQRNHSPFPPPSPAHLTACAFSSYPHHSTKPCTPDVVRLLAGNASQWRRVQSALAGRRSAGITMPRIGTVPRYLCRIKTNDYDLSRII